MRILDKTTTIGHFILLTVFLTVANIALGQTIVTDKPDYPPGDTVFITGTGFSAGETVTVQVIHPDEEADNDSSDAHDPWDVVADGDGNVSTRWTVPADQDEGDAQLELLADGQSSGLHAEYLFTDAATPPPCAITGSSIGCIGGLQTFIGGSGLTYQWAIINNNTGASISGSTSNIVNVNVGNTVGTFTLRLTVISGALRTTCTKIVTTANNPVPDISGSNAVCSGSSATFDAGAGYSSYTWSTGASTQTISVNTAGTYSVTVVDANGCIGSAAQTLAVNANPSPEISGDDVICSGASTTFDAGAGYAGYAWSTGENTQTISVSAAGTYSVTVVDAHGCSGSGNYTLTVNANPTPAISGSNAVCSGASATFDAGAGYASYAWSTGANTQSISANAAGTYSVTVVDANGCSGSADHVLTVNANPTPASGSAAVCSGASATFDAGAGYASYSWSTGANTQTISANAAGTYSVTVVDDNGCSGSGEYTLTVKANPTPAISGGDAVCSGASATFNAGAGYASYAWSTGATTQEISINSAGNYAVTVTNNDGCNGSTSRWFAVNANPAATATSNPGCPGSTLNLSSSGGTTYSWAGPNGFSSVQQNPSINNVTSAAAGTYSVTVTNAAGCTSTAYTSISVYSNPTATASSNSPVVGGTTLNLTSSGGASYSWAGPNSFTSTSQNPSISGVTYLVVGTYTVTVSNSYGCTATATTPVVVTCTGFKSYTYTQGGWGATPNGNNPAIYRNANFPYAFPSGLNVGCGSNWLHLTTSTAVQDFLPSSGTPGSLTQSYTNPGQGLSNTLAGQVAALALNIGFDAYDANFAVSTSMQVKDLYVKSGPFMGWTVLQVLNEAQKVLGGCTSSYTASQLNTACNNINQNYDNGTTDRGYLSCIPVRIANAPPVYTENSLNLYPNPSNGFFVLDLDLGEQVNAAVDIQVLNMLGQVVYLNRTAAINGLLHEEVKLDANLPNGNYLVQVIAGKEAFTKLVIYQK